MYAAVLMPIVASMGGIAATQTLGIYIRAEAMRQLNRKNLRYLFRREFIVALANCIVFSVAIYLITYVLLVIVSLLLVQLALLMVQLALLLDQLLAV